MCHKACHWLLRVTTVTCDVLQEHPQTGSSANIIMTCTMRNKSSHTWDTWQILPATKHTTHFSGSFYTYWADWENVRILSLWFCLSAIQHNTLICGILGSSQLTGEKERSEAQIYFLFRPLDSPLSDLSLNIVTKNDRMKFYFRDHQISRRPSLRVTVTAGDPELLFSVGAAIYWVYKHFLLKSWQSQIPGAHPIFWIFVEIWSKVLSCLIFCSKEETASPGTGHGGSVNWTEDPLLVLDTNSSLVSVLKCTQL